MLVQKPTKFGSPCAVAATVWHVCSQSCLNGWAFSKNMFVVCGTLACIGLRRSHKLRLCSLLLTPLFHNHLHGVFGVLHLGYLRVLSHQLCWPWCNKPWVLSVSSEAFVPIITILIPAADCVLLLHQLVTGSPTVHLRVWFTYRETCAKEAFVVWL